MRWFLFALAAVVFCLPHVEAFSQQLPSDAEIKAAIARLGQNTDEKGFTRFEILYKNPRRSTELLIATLKPVRRVQYPGGNHPPGVSTILPLRSLTRLSFPASTQACPN